MLWDTVQESYLFVVVIVVVVLFLRIAFSKHKNSSSQNAGIQTKVAGGLHG